MNSLYDVRKGSLYHSDTTFLSDVGYKRVSETTAIFIFYEKPNITFPLAVFFQPIGKRNDTISFAYTLTGCRRGKDDLGEACYKVTGRAEGIPESRDDLRINVSFPVDIKLEDQRIIKGEVKDISAGGFMFVAEEELPLGTSVSFALLLAKSIVFIEGNIKHQYPVRSANLKGYGCQFRKLSPATESAIRSFVFHEELVERKKRLDF